jgi:Zn-dependent peptidase ImmA (M78 family)
VAIGVDIAPELFVWAIDRAGWSEQDIERRAPDFHEWVAQTRRPTFREVKKFANDTYTPLGALFLSEPPEESLPLPDMRTMRNKKVARPSANLLDTIYMAQNRQSWYKDYAVDADFSKLSFVGTAKLTTPPENVAQEMREVLKFDMEARSTFRTWSDAFRTLIDRIEDLGVLVMVSGIVGSNSQRKLDPEEFRGFAICDPIAPLIFVNGADTKSAQIFTLIHELANIWLGHSAVSDAAMIADASADEELWCNEVAAEVLVPMEALLNESSGNASPKELDRLAKIFKASTLVVLKRMYDVQLISWDEFENRYNTETKRLKEFIEEQAGKSSGGNYYYTQRMRLGERFSSAVVQGARTGYLSYRDAYKLLGIKTHSTFEKFANMIEGA